MRLKAKDITPLREKIALEQAGLCWLCAVPLESVMACLDHDHGSGRIRGVLCQNCNGIEGKIYNLARRAKRGSSVPLFIAKVLDYWEHFSLKPRTELHPTHKTQDEKRLRRNKKARKRRKKA